MELLLKVTVLLILLLQLRVQVVNVVFVLIQFLLHCIDLAKFLEE